MFMRFRWSNGFSNAVEFTASEKDFADSADEAIQIFRAESPLANAELHVLTVSYLGGVKKLAWMNVIENLPGINALTITRSEYARRVNKSFPPLICTSTGMPVFGLPQRRNMTMPEITLADRSDIYRWEKIWIRAALLAHDAITTNTEIE